MLNEKKVQLMTRMAMYESKQGQEDMKISSYYKKDYVSLNRLLTIIWITIGYVIVVGVSAFVFIEYIFEHLDLSFIVVAGVALGSIYIALVVIYAIASSRFYRRKHEEARLRTKKFNHDLTRLNKMYERERR